MVPESLVGLMAGIDTGTNKVINRVICYRGLRCVTNQAWTWLALQHEMVYLDGGP